DLAGIGLGWIAHPQPDPVVLLDHRVRLHLCRRRDAVLARNLHARTGRVVLQAVIRTVHDVADELAHGERRLPVAAAVLQRHRLAVDGAEKNDRLIEDDPPPQGAIDLMVPCSDVPGVAYEHGSSYSRMLGLRRLWSRSSRFICFASILPLARRCAHQAASVRVSPARNSVSSRLERTI